jgi:pyruvate/2-oxoglutarate dehydrogenase complex dihydrolipoamide acyltransferase (E2) component
MVALNSFNVVDAIPIIIPQETVNDESVRLLSWTIASGSNVEKDQLLCDVETSKAVMEVHAPQAGIVYCKFNAGDEVPVGAAICEIHPLLSNGLGQISRECVNSHTESQEAKTTNGAVASLPRTRLSPLASKLAVELGLSAIEFPPGSLVRKDDVLRKAGRLPDESVAQAEVERSNKTATRRADPPANPTVLGAPVNWTDLPRRKTVENRIIAAGQAHSMQSCVTYVCKTIPFRRYLEAHGLNNAGFGALVVYEVARLLRKYPQFNAVYDAGRIGVYEPVNIGWAIDGGEGLMVPVISHADEKDVRQIAATMEKQMEAYVEGTLTTADFLGGTFTFSDLSSEDVRLFYPLISSGQSAILGLGRESVDDLTEHLYLTLAFDHQLSEGRRAAHFLRDLGERLSAHKLLSQLQSAAGASTATTRAAFCVICQKDAATLRRSKAVLLKSEDPPGAVCSICLGGWS